MNSFRYTLLGLYITIGVTLLTFFILAFLNPERAVHPSMIYFLLLFSFPFFDIFCDSIRKENTRIQNSYVCYLIALFGLTYVVMFLGISQTHLAEKIIVYVYYALCLGCILQIGEEIFDKKYPIKYPLNIFLSFLQTHTKSITLMSFFILILLTFLSLYRDDTKILPFLFCCFFLIYISAKKQGFSFFSKKRIYSLSSTFFDSVRIATICTILYGISCVTLFQEYGIEKSLQIAYLMLCLSLFFAVWYILFVKKIFFKL